MEWAQKGRKQPCQQRQHEHHQQPKGAALRLLEDANALP